MTRIKSRRRPPPRSQVVNKRIVQSMTLFVFYIVIFVAMGLMVVIVIVVARMSLQHDGGSAAQLEVYQCKQHVNDAKNATARTIIKQPPSVPGLDGRPCRYEGHCGVGTTCVVAEQGSHLRGTCRLYTNTLSASSKVSPCVRSCWIGLPADAVVERISNTAGAGVRPDGCILHYRREKGATKRGPVNTSQPHRIVRVDPVLTAKGSSTTRKESIQKWMILCYKPCETKCSKGFVCQEGLCQRDESYWNSSLSSSLGDEHKHKHPMVIVSGADDTYYSGLVNLAGSIRFWAPNHKLVVYNLGLSPEYITQLQKWDIEVKWPDGLPNHYPLHLMNSKTYAWKPVAINESLHEYKQIFWIDAGSTVTSLITEAIRITQETGIFVVKGQDGDMHLAHPCTYKAFGYDKATFVGGPHYSGNTQAYLYPSRYVDTVVIPNAECALRSDCITPEGSSLDNHRYDQTTLSILSYRHDLVIPEYTKYLACCREQLADDLRKPSPHFVWTSRNSCSDFWNEMEGFDGFEGVHFGDMGFFNDPGEFF